MRFGSAQPEYGTDPTALLARNIVGALVGSGVKHIVISPGSRNAPLTYAAAAAERAGLVKTHVRIDERTAGFFALGLARGEALGGEVSPVALCTTSGTAVANLHPAIAEADANGIPLIAVTADRPARLRGTGANQTTWQVGIFGQNLRAQADLPATDSAPAAVIGQVFRLSAAATGQDGRPGPVQLNVCLDSPLAGIAAEPQIFTAPTRPKTEGGAPGWPAALKKDAATVIVAADDTGDGANIVALSRAMGWPLLAEPTSPACYGPALAHYLYYLDKMEGIEQVLVSGHPTLSRPITALLSRSDINIVAVKDATGRYTDIAGTVNAVLERVPEAPASQVPLPRKWLAADKAVEKVLAERLSVRAEAGEALDPLQVACAIWTAHATDPHTAPRLLFGASNTIRLVDRAGHTPDSAVNALANRGLAGIDGTISCGRGIATATGAPVRVVVGDLTFLHDIGGLINGRYEQDADLQIVVLNDAGGSIFAGLEHGGSNHVEDFPRYFATPQNFSLAALAAGLGAEYQMVGDLGDLERLLAMPVRGVSIIEVDTAVPGLAQLDRNVAEKISAALQPLFS